MAKLNWQKVAVDSQIQSVREDARDFAISIQEKQDLLQAGIWSIGTKHYGKKLKS